MKRFDNYLLAHIYSFDSTYHEIYRSVLRELLVNLELKELFEHDIVFVIHNVKCLRGYDKKDFERFALSLKHKTSRKVTRKRLIAKLCCYYLQKGKLWYLPIGSKGMWVFS